MVVFEHMEQNVLVGVTGIAAAGCKSGCRTWFEPRRQGFTVSLLGILEPDRAERTGKIVEDEIFEGAALTVRT